MKEADKVLETDNLLELVKDSPQIFGKMVAQGDCFDKVSLTEYLQELLNKHELTMMEVVRISLLSKSYVYQIFNGERMPSRDVLLRIGLSMSCTIDEIQHLLILAQTGNLYPKVKRDAAILCCISQKLSLTETNDFLEHIGERTLL
ncbi:MAG: helix-turn-helix transcriptional regulator [Bacteroides sp.]|nr:helix-turn-helix transcriptional regulator [Bacteroides sp.]MCM1550090.1 helix-turn-helix transcriptional regulator [Clostridium sp.]